MPIIPKPLNHKLSDWVDQEDSVVEHPMMQALKKLVRFTGVIDPNENIQSLMNPMAAPLVSIFKNKAARMASTAEFLEQVKRLGPNIGQAGEEFAEKYPRVAAHAWPMEESGYHRYPPDTPAAADIPYGKVERRIPIEFTDNPSGRASAKSLPESRANMFHEGTHVAQALGNSKAVELYDEAERLLGYNHNPFEQTANYAGSKAAGFPQGMMSRIDRPENAIKQLEGYAQDLGPTSKLAKLLASRKK